MGLVARSILAFLVGVATFYFVFWLPFSLLSWLPGHLLFALGGSLAAAIWSARYIWRRTAGGGDRVLALTLGGALTVGAIGFVGGFFGPMIWAPDANQGPLLGLLITGPLGFALGGVAGLIYGLARKRVVEA